MIIGSNRKLAGISSFSLSIFDTDINSVTSFKYLGVILSSTFTWCDHAATRMEICNVLIAWFVVKYVLLRVCVVMLFKC